ncbi:CpsD/CapB family tyrosine-protein kinase [Pleionea sediminis]|uniref:CpsD/CapB family tyrosine-protein kinase n=1 Tax=Pleionea sediminis TaxID=2569479 RepID=UPI001186F718|nr:CpsD/CapB family tyrosine-protein kinase [Pleionea sediminis]
MSTVEKAFLKSLEKEKKEESLIEKAAEQTAYSEPVNVQRKDTQQLVTSRKSISNMAQVEKYSAKELAERRLIFSNMANSKLLDSFRNLRTRLLASCDKDNFVTLVAPVVPDKESYLISANLAATFALDEAKTSMLIEADIHNPRLNSVFDLGDQQGLIDFLEDDSQDSASYLHKTRVPRLRMVPSGLKRENSAEYFTSDKMHEFISELVSRYPDRFPIINAPSILDSADARILVELCDQVVLVVPYGECSQEDILKASVTVGQEKLAGLLLNNF